MIVIQFVLLLLCLLSPKQGRFYMHDVRNNAPEAGNDESNDAETETKSRSRADRVDEWKHDVM